MGRRPIARVFRWLAIGVFCVFLVSLSVSWVRAIPHEQPRDLFAEAEQLALDQRWDEAKQLLKVHLLKHPDDAGAHFYLGRAYLLATPFYPYIAEGEFQTALRLFIANGRKSPTERFQPDYFEMMCHIESAKVYLRWIYVWMTHEFDLRELQHHLNKAKFYLEKAREIRPDAPEVRQLYETLTFIDGDLPADELPRGLLP